MLKRMITGGQTGADQGGWQVAKACGISTGGTKPKGILTKALLLRRTSPESHCDLRIFQETWDFFRQVF
jgi:hypothetical protein